MNQATTAVDLAAKEEVRYRELLKADAAVPASAVSSELLAVSNTAANLTADSYKLSAFSSSVPLYSLQDRTDNRVDFKIKETEINDFTVGDKIQMQGRNDSVKLDGTVESIRRKADFATQKATSERGDVDIIAFNLKVRTNDERIYPGMRFKLLR